MELDTPNDIIDALGGTAATARLTKKCMQQVSDWRTRGRIASRCFLIMSAALEKIGHSASPEIWGIDEPE